MFGSGLAIVPFLHGGVVNQFHWLTERQFLDAVAVAMITPGPVVITVAFIGYLVAGPLGAVAAAIGVFLPCYLFVVIPAPYFRRFADNPRAARRSSTASPRRRPARSPAPRSCSAGGRSSTCTTVADRRSPPGCSSPGSRSCPEPLVILAAGVLGLALRR